MKKQNRKSPSLLAVACLAIAALFTTSPLHAAEEPEPAAATAAKRLMKTMEVEKQMAPMMQSMKQIQTAMLDQQELSDEQKAQAKELMSASMEEVEKALEWSRLEAMMVRVYAATFSADEMNNLSNYFESPEGQIYIKKQPQLQASMMVEMQQVMAELMPKIQAKTQEVIQRIQQQKAVN